MDRLYVFIRHKFSEPGAKYLLLVVLLTPETVFCSRNAQKKA